MSTVMSVKPLNLLVNKVLYSSKFRSLFFLFPTRIDRIPDWLPLPIHMHIGEICSNLSSLCASSLEGRARCSWNPEAGQAFGKAVWASAGERESSVPPTILLGRRHQTLLHFPVSVALGFSAVFNVAAPLPPEARTLLAAQMVQRRCPLSWA